MPNENMMAISVISVIKKDFVYIHMQSNINRHPMPMSHPSMIKYLSNSAFFSPISIATTDTNSFDNGLKV